MNQAEFQAKVQEYAQANGESNGKLETWVAVADELRAADIDTPDGGDWGGLRLAPDGSREAYRSFCIWREVPLADGTSGVYALPNADSLSRFR